METKFRSLPLSLIDFFGVLIPGLAWLLLLDTTRAMFTTSPQAITPLVVSARFGQLSSGSETWFGSVSVLFVALVIGYIAKPRAMHLATRVPIQLMGTDSLPKTDEPRDTPFPYRARHCGKAYFETVERLTKDLTGCAADELPGPQPFGVMKRLLRLIAPALWEELEHREAEVRLLGSLFLVSVFSSLLALAELGRELFYAGEPSLQAAGWLLTSSILALLAGDGFGHLRRREVEYTYLHTIVALNAREKGLLGSSLINTPSAGVTLNVPEPPPAA